MRGRGPGLELQKHIEYICHSWALDGGPERGPHAGTVEGVRSGDGIQSLWEWLSFISAWGWSL